MKVLAIKVLYYFIRTSANDTYCTVYENNSKEESLLTETTLNHILNAIKKGTLIPVFQNGYRGGDYVEFYLYATSDFEMFDPFVIPGDYVRKKTLPEFIELCHSIIINRDELGYKRYKWQDEKRVYQPNDVLFGEQQ